MSDSLKRNNFVLYVSLAAGIGVLFILWMILSAPKDFPQLPSGGYSGTISGVGDGQSPTETFYVERLGQVDAMVFVVFGEGFEPQVIPIRRELHGPETGGATSDSVSLEPITLNFRGGAFELRGKESRGKYKGDVLVAGKKIGNWELRRLEHGDLSEGVAAVGETGPALSEWLNAQSEYGMLASKVADTKGRLKSQQDRLEKLKKFIEDASLLQARAGERRDNLRAEVAKAKENRQSESTQLESLVSELDMLKRIKKRGKAVELARKVASRESKWYLVNWQAEEEGGGFEQELSSNMNIDGQKLESALKKANEVRHLVNEIETEKRRIREIEEKLRTPEPEAVEPGQSVKEERPGHSLWDRIFE